MLRRRALRGTAPSAEEVLGLLRPPEEGEDDVSRRLRRAADLLRGPTGIAVLVRDASARSDVSSAVALLEENILAEGRSPEISDALWSIRMDRLREAEEIASFLGVAAPTACDGQIANWWSLTAALSALDRLEVRGRDSAGLAVIVTAEALARRSADVQGSVGDPLLRSGSRLDFGDTAAFVYKVAAEIGELGDNTRALREALFSDEVLKRTLALPGAYSGVLAHTRWASVGLITEANAHPLASPSSEGAQVLAAVNGDIDNYAELADEHGLESPREITTDSWVVATLTHRLRGGGLEMSEAFRAAVREFEGAHAVVACALDDSHKFYLARRGSGQALYAGLCDDALLVVSEPHALVEQTDSYLCLDGSSAAGDGEIMVLDSSGFVPQAPSRTSLAVDPLPAAPDSLLGGIRRLRYDGVPLETGAPTRTQISSADIHRGGFEHYLLKEISEAPTSFAKTLAGRIVPTTEGHRVDISSSLSFPLADVRRIICIGQGTAAVAAAAIAEIIEDELPTSKGISVAAMPASELSGFGLLDHMGDTLVIAVSQSGTTTDTNRTVDLAKARGARVLAVVNRRESDLMNKADGVLYTSDGRDVEMSVASTKAFYSQVAAGFLLACSLGEALGGERIAPTLGADIDHETLEAAAQRRSGILSALEALPDAMQEVLKARPQIAEIARNLAPSRRHWATVGNGRGRLAAEELRIKLSELCYRTVSCDVTENKKHIDLSSEPLILVCATGLLSPQERHGSQEQGTLSTAAKGNSQSVLKDVLKEIDIYRAHRAAPVVLTDRPEFSKVCDRVVTLPAVHPAMSFVLAAMAGHLFAYEAAVAINATAEPLRRSRAAALAILEEAPSVTEADAEVVLRRLRPVLQAHFADFTRLLQEGRYDGHLPSSQAVRLASLFRYALGAAPLSSYEVEFGKMGAPSELLEDFLAAVSEAADELQRPVDAIRHQAKTVTVGISRSEDALVEAKLTKEALAAGASLARLSYDTLSTLAGLSPSVARVTGSIRYVVDGERIEVEARFGVAATFESRVDTDHALRGTKRQVCEERRVLLTKGRRDGRVILLLPEVSGGEAVGLVLLHLELPDRLEARVAREVLRRYRDRFSRLRNAVTETEADFDELRLAEVPVLALLTGDPWEIADYWSPKEST